LPLTPTNLPIFVETRTRSVECISGVKNWGRNGQILTPNEFDLTTWVSDYGAVSSKSSENCNHRRVERQT